MSPPPKKTGIKKMTNIQNAINGFLAGWSVDILGSWSIMDFISLILVLTMLAAVLNYFFYKADAK